METRRRRRRLLGGGPAPAPLVGLVAVASLVAAAALVAGCGGDGKTLREPPPGATAPLRPTSTTVQGTVATAGDFLSLASPSFDPGGELAATSTCEGDGVSPALNFSGVESDVVELAVVAQVQDQDLTTLWVVAGLDPGTVAIPEGALPPDAVVALNAEGQAGWLPPCPPEGEEQIVQFDLYALLEPSGVTADMSAIDATTALAATRSVRAALTSTVSA